MSCNKYFHIFIGLLQVFFRAFMLFAGEAEQKKLIWFSFAIHNRKYFSWATVYLAHGQLCGVPVQHHLVQNLYHHQLQQQQTSSQASSLLQYKPVPQVVTLQHQHQQQQHLVLETAAAHLTPIPESAVVGPAARGPEFVVTSYSCCCLLLFGSGLIIGSSLTNHIQTFAHFFLFSVAKYSKNLIPFLLNV